MIHLRSIWADDSSFNFGFKFGLHPVKISSDLTIWTLGLASHWYTAEQTRKEPPPIATGGKFMFSSHQYAKDVQQKSKDQVDLERSKHMFISIHNFCWHAQQWNQSHDFLSKKWACSSQPAQNGFSSCRYLYRLTENGPKKKLTRNSKKGHDRRPNPSEKPTQQMATSRPSKAGEAY